MKMSDENGKRMIMKVEVGDCDRYRKMLNQIYVLMLENVSMFSNVFKYVQITDPTTQRFEVPHEQVGSFSGPAASNLNYRVEVRSNPFGIVVTRVSGKVL